MGVLKATGTHESQTCVPLDESPEKRRRVTVEPKTTKVDELTLLFNDARQYITETCFVYSFLHTLLWSVA